MASRWPRHVETTSFVLRTESGWVAWRQSARGLQAISLPASTPEQACAVVGESPAEPATATSGPLAARLLAFYAGAPADFADLALDLAPAGPFTEAVRAVVRGIPRGAVMTYGEVAAAAGRPRAARAVGGVMARNPVPPVIPCHRVVAAGHRLGGFGGGLGLKLALLRAEGSTAPWKEGLA